MADAAPAPYWQGQRGVAPVKPEFVLWEKVGRNHHQQPVDAPDDDAAEGQTFVDAKDGEERAAKRPKVEIEKKRGGQNRGKERKAHNLPKLPISAQLCPQISKDLECAKHSEGNCKFMHDLSGYLASKAADIELASIAENADTDLAKIETLPTESIPCPVYLAHGICFYGWKCRFLQSHVTKVENGSGFQGTDSIMAYDEAKMRNSARTILSKTPEAAETMSMKELRAFLCKTKAELNMVLGEQQRLFRGKRADSFPLTSAWFQSIGETFGGSEDSNHARGAPRKGKGRVGQRNKEREAAANSTKMEVDGSAIEASENDAKAPVGPAAATEKEDNTAKATETPGMDTEPTENAASNTKESIEMDVEEDIEIIMDTNMKQSAKGDRPVRAPREKRNFDVRNKLYLAPLTTTGNLPFRRLCVQYGAEITCGEMGLATEYLAGNPQEWSLVRRHPSERVFGVQIAGSRPQQLVPCGEAIVRACPDVDFVDVNCGCPIDLVVKKGAGSALMTHATRLTSSLLGLSEVLGDIPLTFKMRMGAKDGDNIAHRLAARTAREGTVSAITVGFFDICVPVSMKQLHGRTRQQRYSRLADHDYIATCVKHLRKIEEEEGLPRLPFIGNGDAYNHEEFWSTIEKTGVDTIMVARGALIKPWIFTELSERKIWDISARERLDGIKQLANFGMEHWGSDDIGLRETRRFVLEALSFQHRYIPVGILERLPVQMNERPHPFRGRNDLETLLSSPAAADWQKIADMVLGKPDDSFVFIPKHKSSAYEMETQG